MNLTILSTSDTHGYLYPTDFRKKEQSLAFGLTKVAQEMKQVEANTEGPVVKIDNGDFLQGSPLSYYLAKNPEAGSMAEVMNALGYDCGVLGNHEFNYGIEYLEKTIENLNYPIVCANILKKSGGYLTGQPYVILEKDGLKIAVLGLTTPYIPNWEKPETVKELIFESALETAKVFVPKLKQEADIVVVSYHGGFERDLYTTEATEALTGENEGFDILNQVPGIDVFLTGHQHRVLAINDLVCPVTQPGDKGKYLAKVDVTLDESKKIQKTEASLISMASKEEDPALNKQFLPLLNEVEDWLDKNLGLVEGDMTITNPMSARQFGHPYVEFIQDVQKEATGVDISGTALFDNNGTGFKQRISMRDIVTNYIYPNTLAVLELNGKELKLALEKSASYFEIDESKNLVVSKDFLEPKVAHYNYDMYSGIDYTIDVTKPVGSRVTQFEYQGKEIKEDDLLKVVMNQYRAVGGGDYSMFGAEKIIQEVTIDMTELISSYLEKNPKVLAKQPTNFKISY